MYAIINKTTRRVLEVTLNEAASLEAMQASNGTATRAVCPEHVFFDYCSGKEVYAHYEAKNFKEVITWN